MFFRFGFLYSCFVAVAGASLLAEIPEKQSTTSGTPVVHADQIEVQPTPANSQVIQQTSGIEVEFTAPASIEEFREKQKQLEKLRQEISELEIRLGLANAYQVNCVLAEVDMEILRKLDPVIQWDNVSVSLVELLETPDALRPLTPQQYRAIEECLKATGALKILMEPVVVARVGEPASVMSGGETAQVTDQQPLGMRFFGNSFLTEITPIGPSRLSVHVGLTHSSRDFTQIIKVQGQNIPTILSKGMNYFAELSEGETVIQTAALNDNDEKTSTRMFSSVRLSAVRPLNVTAERPQLKPVPETELR